MSATDPVLAIRDLSVSYGSGSQAVRAVDRVSLDLHAGEVVGLVGESGSGKSTLAYGACRLLRPPALITGGSVRYQGRRMATPADILQLSPDQLMSLRWREIAIVFQSAMNALNPVLRVRDQLTDVIRAHLRVSAGEAAGKAGSLLDLVGIPRSRLRAYPHELSGGMRQRVMIAMALLVEPKLLIADEPTTALDATIEAQIVELLRDIRREIRGSVILISHSLGLVAELCDQIVVMYAGKVVENGPVAEVFAQPRHPYTRALLGCEIDPWQVVDASIPLPRIPGSPPDLVDPPRGCVFAARCPQRFERCSEPPPLTPAADGRAAACWLA